MSLGGRITRRGYLGSEGVSSMHAVDIAILVGWVVFWIYWLAVSVGVKACIG
jgi:hypothetical protein